MAVKGVFKDLVGKTFGRLTVVRMYRKEERQWKKQKATVIYWWCRCVCGNEKEISASGLLKKSGIRSCGCALKEWKKTLESRSLLFKEGTAYRKVLAQYKHDAKRRGLSWELSEEEFKHLTTMPCHFTGKFPSVTMEAASGETYTYNGVDRLNSKEGYTVNNCVPCCTEVNFMKRNLPYEKFIELCKIIAERF